MICPIPHGGVQLRGARRCRSCPSCQAAWEVGPCVRSRACVAQRQSSACCACCHPWRAAGPCGRRRRSSGCGSRGVQAAGSSVPWGVSRPPACRVLARRASTPQRAPDFVLPASRPKRVRHSNAEAPGRNRTASSQELRPHRSEDPMWQDRGAAAKPTDCFRQVTAAWMVPGEGIEPPTFGLQNRCTTAVLTRQGRAFPSGRLADKAGPHEGRPASARDRV